MGKSIAVVDGRREGGRRSAKSSKGCKRLLWSGEGWPNVYICRLQSYAFNLTSTSRLSKEEKETGILTQGEET